MKSCGSGFCFRPARGNGGKFVSMHVPRVTIPWTVLSLLLALAVGLYIDYRAEAEWIAPAVMAAMTALLIALGRIPEHRMRELKDK